MRNKELRAFLGAEFKCSAALRELRSHVFLEQAKKSISTDRLKKTTKCSVCGADTAIAGSEPLCWVCRRLKISAWRDIEQQMPAQE